MNENGKIEALLVEDDDEDALIFSRYVGNLKGCRVHLERAPLLKDAEFILTTRHFDIVFLDLNMGAPLNGLDFLKRMRQVGLRTPIIIVTGLSDRQKAVEAMKNGAYDYLVKDSLTTELIEEAIKGVDERYAGEQERDIRIAKLGELIGTDELTAVANRRRLIEKIQEETERSRRTGRPFALFMMDLDHFKAVNDKYGHQTGDLVLRECAAILQKSVRVVDLVARYGGEEFCVVLPETDAEGARITAERIRAAVEEAPDPMPTISIGVAVWHKEIGADRILSSADKALYEAKHSGRNRVVFAEES